MGPRRSRRSRHFAFSLVIALAVATIGCADQGDEGGDQSPPPSQPPPAETTRLAGESDAAPAAHPAGSSVDHSGADSAETAPGDSSAHIPVYDPASGYHLDEVVEYVRPARKPAPVAKKQIQITLRSSPPGALASVDGAVIGRTPTLWVGEANAERQFTFVLPGYVMARYRFIATTDGTVHGQLTKMTKDAPDAGVANTPASQTAPN